MSEDNPGVIRTLECFTLCLLAAACGTPSITYTPPFDATATMTTLDLSPATTDLGRVSPDLTATSESMTDQLNSIQLRHEIECIPVDAAGISPWRKRLSSYYFGLPDRTEALTNRLSAKLRRM